MASKQVLVVIVVVTVATVLAAAPALALAIDLRDSQGWRLDVDYDDWINGNEFILGDTLVFKYAKDQHSVVQATAASYTACSQANSLAVWTSGDDRVALNTSGTCALFGWLAGCQPASSDFLSHQFSTSHQPPASQQYFSLTTNQPQPPATSQPNKAACQPPASRTNQHWWFFCGVGNHCEQGMKFNVTVLPAVVLTPSSPPSHDQGGPPSHNQGGGVTKGLASAQGGGLAAAGLAAAAAVAAVAALLF